MQRDDTLWGLQYIRGFAALIVVLCHTSTMAEEPKYFSYSPFGGVLNSGGGGVDLFFVLSGFIMVFIALTPTLTPRIGLWDFMKRRFIRIIPFLWAAVLIYAGLRVVGRGAFDIWPYVRAMVLFPIGSLQPNVAWTLRNEFLFYAVFAFSVLWLRQLRWLLLLWVVSPLILTAAGGRFGTDPLGELGGLVFHPMNLLFGLGGAVAALFFAARARLAKISPWWLMAALTTFVPFACACGETFQDLPHVLILAPISATCIFVGALVRAPATIFGRIASFLGDASYSVYLTHTMFISAVMGAISHRFAHVPAAVWLPVTAAGAVVWGCLLHLYVERPIVRLARRRLDAPIPAMVKAA